MANQCGNCGLIDENMQRCSNCHVVYYCSRRCQKKDWKEKHRILCNQLKYGYDPEEEVTSEYSDSSISVVYSSDSCATCGNQDRLSKCAQCLTILYCSKSCQRKHWPRHKTNCKQNQEVVDVIKTDGFKKQQREAKTEKLQAQTMQQFLRYGTAHILPENHGRFGPPSRNTSHPFDLSEKMSTSISARKQAKLFVERKFPMQQIVDVIDDIPEPRGFFPSLSNANVSFLGFITRYGSYRERHSVIVQDVKGEEICVSFHLDHDCPYPYFTWGDVRPGKYLCLSDPRVRYPFWGPGEIRVDDPSDAFLFDIDG